VRGALTFRNGRATVCRRSANQLANLTRSERFFHRSPVATRAAMFSGTPVRTWKVSGYDKMGSLHNGVRSAVDFCRDSFGEN
jgi:hypothetical protein